MSKHSIKTVEVLQISAGLTAALRWAIALMPLDGVRFTLSSREWFEPLSFVLSILFVVVEIGATAYIMRAWRKEVDKQTQSALLLLWVVALALMLVAQVPPLIANIDGVSVATFHPLLKIVWVTCGVAVTFVVIGGVGYAEKSLEAQAIDEDCHCPICLDVIGSPVWLTEQHGDKYLAYCDKCQRAYTASEVVWLPTVAQAGASLTQPAQVPQMGETDAPSSVTGDDSGHDASQSRQEATSSAVVVENVQSTAEASSEALSVVLERGKVTTADIILEYYQRNPNATLTQAAQHVRQAIGKPYSSEAVRQALKRLEVAGKVARNGHVEVLP